MSINPGRPCSLACCRHRVLTIGSHMHGKQHVGLASSPACTHENPCMHGNQLTGRALTPSLQAAQLSPKHTPLTSRTGRQAMAVRAAH